MLRRYLLIPAILLSTSANAYMFEGTYTYIGGDVDPKIDGVSASKADINNHSVDLKVYLSDVDISLGAWDEAAFLNKASNVTGQWHGIKIDDDSEEFKSNAYLVGGRAVVNNYILQAAISTNKDSDDEKSQASSFGFGAYLNDHHALTGSVSFIKGSDVISDFDTYQLDVNYHGIFPVAGTKQSMALDVTVFMLAGTYEDVEEVGTLSDTTQGGIKANFIYYPIPKFGVGAGLRARGGKVDVSDTPDIDIQNTAGSLFAHWYPVEQFRIGLSLETGSDNYEVEGSSNKIDLSTNLYAFDLRVRF